MDIDLKDPGQTESYKHEVPRLVEKHGGEYLVRGGDHEVIAGVWEPTRLVIFRFPSRQSIRDLFNDPEVQPLKALQRRVASSNIVAVDGPAMKEGKA